MIDLRPVLFIIGILLAVLAAAMVAPAAADLVVGNVDWQVFVASSGVTLFVAVALILSTRSSVHGFSVRQAFVMTTFAWLTIAAFGALPFAFCELDLTLTDAFFESMSGITTTGSTVIVGLEDAPPGILLWRSILQWLGGIGIIVMAVAVFPILRVGGMQMFRVEAFEADKVLPRAAQVAAGIALVYLGLSVVAAGAYMALGMTPFDAVAHAMTSIATGGYSTHDASFAFWHDTPGIHWATSVVMILGSVPFVLYLRATRGELLALLRDSQVKWMLAILGGAIAITALVLVHNRVLPTEAALRHGTFNVISVMTGTGYASTDFYAWGGVVPVLMFMLMFIGGCAGSTTCGIKIFRVQIVYAEARVQMRRLMQPNGVFIPYYNKRPIPDAVARSVMGFFFLYMISFAALALALGLMGVDFITAVSGAATAISNVGPGLGPTIGPSGTFTSLPDAAKWMLCAGMILGRLELFTVLVLFSPAFWRG